MFLKEDGTAKTLYLSQSSFSTKIYMNVYHNHLSYITDIKMYSKQYICSRCNKLFARMENLNKHQTKCDGTVDLECYMDWFLSLICKNYIFKYFVKTIEPTSLKFCLIIELITLHLEYTIAHVKYANFSYVHVQTFVLLNGEMATVSTGFRKLKYLVVVTLDCLLPEPNRLLKDLLD